MSQVKYEQIGVAMTCRGYEEYIRMFDLNESDLAGGPVLDVAAGGSSFTAEAKARGYEACAVDPRYGNDVKRWVEEAREEIGTSTAKLAKLADIFDWSYYGSIDQHRAGREASLLKFEADVNDPSGQSSYVSGKLPNLPFADGTFSLVLCSHFLFLYAEQFGLEFHKQAIAELMRVTRKGGQIRIYPLQALNWEPFAQLDELLTFTRANGGNVQLLPSKLPFIPKKSDFIRISH
jgi:SAM-dependent methyltransferase